MELTGLFASAFLWPLFGGLYILVILLALILGIGIRLIDITSEIKENQKSKI